MLGEPFVDAVREHGHGSTRFGCLERQPLGGTAGRPAGRRRVELDQGGEPSVVVAAPDRAQEGRADPVFPRERSQDVRLSAFGGADQGQPTVQREQRSPIGVGNDDAMLVHDRTMTDDAATLKAWPP